MADQKLTGYHYVYILISETDPTKHYVGFTSDLHARLEKHNEGGSPHTSQHRPWRIDTATAFHDRTKALAFEQYLKSHSGRAFAKKHF